MLGESGVRGVFPSPLMAAANRSRGLGCCMPSGFVPCCWTRGLVYAAVASVVVEVCFS